MNKKDFDYYMELPYQKMIVSSSEGGYVGYIPELKGCITQGETKEEVLAMLEDAKACWIEAALEDGIEIPKPNIQTLFNEYREAIYAKARENGTYNETGELVVSKDDPWMQGTFHEPK